MENLELLDMMSHEIDLQRTSRRSLFSAVIPVALLLVLCACEKSSKDHLADAREQLAGSSFADALSSVEAGLAADPDAVSTWGLELVKLEALSRSGQGEAARDQLEWLLDENPDRIAAADFSGTAQLLRAADQKAVAIQVLDMGLDQFPEDSVINKMISDSIEKGVDPEELEQLRSLGYID